jgi:hypothetical protein
MIVPPASSNAEMVKPGSDRELRRPWGRRTAIPALAICAAAVLPLSACASGSPTSASSPAFAKTCQRVGAVLSDGPDPTQDPVGYAEAQILPLRQVPSSDPALRTAISELASAYAKFFAANGKSSAATSAVVAAATHMNKLCPGAGAGG